MNKTVLHIIFSAVLVLTSVELSIAADKPGRAAAHAAVPWWKTAVIYQLYPRSFYDSNGDGIGDIKGIIAKLDYLQSLGIDAIWLNPCYPSPLFDTGYDISDYRNIDPQYGTLDDFDNLVREAKKRNIRIIMDLVLNHTSDQHPWFKESRSSRTNPKADWYVWRDGKPNGDAPNNWRSFDPRTVSAWQWEPARKQFYYHIYAPEQPDLNWRNPEVRKEMMDTARFWLDRGVAGFRLDAVISLFEDEQFRDNPPPPTDPDKIFEWIVFGKYTYNLPELHDVMRELRKIMDSYDGDRVIIGETDARTFDDLLAMYGKNQDEMQLPMNFNIFWSRVSAPEWRKLIAQWDQGGKGGWPLYFLSNHDGPRSYTRFADKKHDDRIAKLMATLLLTVRGTPIVYYGEELGMANVSEEFIKQGMERSGKILQPRYDARDAERTPMQWTDGPAAGFTSGTPWLPVAETSKSYNVDSELADPNSILNLYRRLLKLRKDHEALREGIYTELNSDDQNVLSYSRGGSDANELVLVALNMSGQPRTARFNLGGGKVNIESLVSNTGGSARISADGAAEVTLEPFGVFVGAVKKSK